MEQPCPIDTHLCVNTHGSFACHELTGATACPAGFKFNSLEKNCQGKKKKRLNLIFSIYLFKKNKKSSIELKIMF